MKQSDTPWIDLFLARCEGWMVDMVCDFLIDSYEAFGSMDDCPVVLRAFVEKLYPSASTMRHSAFVMAASDLVFGHTLARTCPGEYVRHATAASPEYFRQWVLALFMCGKQGVFLREKLPMMHPVVRALVLRVDREARDIPFLAQEEFLMEDYIKVFDVAAAEICKTHWCMLLYLLHQQGPVFGEVTWFHSKVAIRKEFVYHSEDSVQDKQAISILNDLNFRYKSHFLGLLCGYPVFKLESDQRDVEVFRSLLIPVFINEDLWGFAQREETTRFSYVGFAETRGVVGRQRWEFIFDRKGSPSAPYFLMSSARIVSGDEEQSLLS